MKTKLTSFLKRTSLLLALACLFVPLNTWADPIAIGTGTVTLNYANTSNPVSPTLQTIQSPDIFNNERSIAFSNPDGGYASRDYGYVEWATTIEPGIYEVEIKYGSFAWNVTPLFAVYQNNSKIKDIYVTTAKNSGAWKTWADFSPESFLVDLTDGIDPNTNYTIRVTETYDGAWGLIIGHISFTPSTSHFATWGFKTGGNAFDDGQFPSNGSDTEKGVTIESNISYGEVSQGTYAYKFGSESYVEIYVGAGRVITDIATSVLCDGTNDGAELQISFSPSTPFNTNDASTPATFKSNGWTNYESSNNPAMTSISIPEGTKSAKITKSASASHENYLYRLKVVSEDVSGGGGDEHTVYFESSNNNYGTVDVASISSVPNASTVSIANNVLTLNGTDVTATPVSATAEYTYAFSNWSVSNGDEITENQTITATFTRTANSYTLTWDLNGGTVTTAGTGAAVNATGTPNSSVAYGTAITAPVVSKAGYSFVGWNATPSSTMPAANTTYTAQWQGVPAVTNLNAVVDDDDVTISWTNYNKLDLTSDNAKEEGWNDHGTINSRSVANGVLTVSYTTDAEWAWKSIEVPLSREMNHVTSIDMQYTYNNAQAKDGNNEGGIAPYMMYNGDGGWTCFWKRSDPTSLGFWASNVTEYTNYNLTPDQILGSTGSGSYDNQRLIHKVGLLIDPAVASSGTFTVKDICINTTDGQTTLDEIKVIRKLNSAPTSISDGDEVYSGVLNTFTDNNLENGTYYYAVYARKGSNYSEAVTTGPVQIGPVTYTLTWNLNGGTVTTAGTGAAVDATGTPSTSLEEGDAITTPKVAKDGYAFVGWNTTPASTMPAANTTYTAQWIEIALHQPGKYETPQGEGGYGATLKSVNSRNYEVYRFNYADSKGALYAGSTSTVTDGYPLITDATSTESKGDNWVAVKPHDYQSGGPYSIGSEFLSISGYARIGNTDYIRLYVQGYDQFAFAGRDYHATGDHLVIKIDGVTQDSYTINTSDHISDRFTLTTNEPHIIEITASSNDYHNRVLGFSLRLPIDETPRAVTYAKGNEAVTGDLPANGSYAPLAEFSIPAKGNLAWAGHEFIGWSDGTNMYQPGNTYTMPSNAVTLTAQWAEFHQQGKYETSVGGGGYGRTLQTYDNREYEVYLFKQVDSKGALYAGPETSVVDGYQLFNNASNNIEASGDNWIFVKAYDYSADNHAFANEFSQLNSVSTLSPQSARLDNVSYVRLYVQGYDQFTFIGIDSYVDIASHYFVVNIDGVAQSYTPDKDHYNYTRFDLDASEPHIIEITGSSSDYHNRFFGFSLRLPADDTQRSVTYAKGDEAVTGDLPASGSYVWGETFDLPAQGTLAWTGHHFTGWSDGTTTYAPGTTYTMPRHEVSFTAQWIAPVIIGNTEARLDAINTISAYTTATDVDIDGDNTDDECMDLRNAQADWQVYIQQGLYNITLEYGKPNYGLKAKILLIDPSNNDNEIELQYYEINGDYETGEQGRIEVRGQDFSSITEDHLYIIRVKDTYTGCYLRVKGITFNPFEPINEPSLMTLDSSNVFTSPGLWLLENVHCIHPKANGKAEWYAYLQPTAYNISFRYGAPSGGVNVTLSIVDPATDEVLLTKNANKSGSASALSTVSFDNEDLSTKVVAGKPYLIRIEDTYDGTSSRPCIEYIKMMPMSTHTRSGLRVGDYGTVCLPYGVAHTDREGAELFEIEEWSANGTSLTLTELNSDEDMVAGRPYIYQATASTATFRYYPEGDPAEVLDPEDCNGLTGSYTKEIIEQSPDNFIIYNNKLYPVNNLAYVGANKAYIHRITNTTPSQVSRRRVTLTLYGEQVVTGIDQINNQSEIINQKLLINGQLIIIRDGKTYNALGQPVNQ